MASEDGTKPKRAGRPAKYPGEGKRPTLTFRVRGGVHEQLQDAAAKSGRSISEEIERRVETSFTISETLWRLLKQSSDQLIDTLANGMGGRGNLSVAISIGSYLARMERKAGGSWRESEQVRSQVEQKLIEYIPDLLLDPPPPWGEETLLEEGSGPLSIYEWLVQNYQNNKEQNTSAREEGA